MKSYEIFRRMSPDLARSILDHLLDTEREGYNSVLAGLAVAQRLRPQFVQRKPRAERQAWIARHLGRKQSDAYASNILQIWLVAARAPMLCHFLDALGIQHDERGMIDDIPAQPDPATIDAALESLLAAFPREEVAIYLQAFGEMDDPVWPHLLERLATDPRLAPGIPQDVVEQ